MVALSAASAAMVLKLPYPAEILIPAAILAGLLAGTAAGVLNAVLALLGGLHPIVVTLGTLTIYRGLVIAMLGGRPMTGLPPQFGRLAIDPATGFRGSVAVAALVVLLVYLWMAHTRSGRHVYALGSAPRAAGLLGLSKARLWPVTFGLGGLLAGLAGVLQLSMGQQMQARLGAGWELSAIAVAVIGGVGITGGRGTVLGVVLGALLLRLVNSALVRWGVSDQQTDLVVGSLILAALLLGSGLARMETMKERGQERAGVAAAPPGGRANPWIFGLLPWCLLALALLLVFSQVRRPALLVEVWVPWIEVGTLAFVMTAIILTGGIDLSVGSMVALTGMVQAVLWQDWGLVHSSRGRRRPPDRGSGRGFQRPAGGGRPLPPGGNPGHHGFSIGAWPSPSPAATASPASPKPSWIWEDFLGVPSQFWLAGLVFLGMFLLVHHTRFGRWCFAMGDNRPAARFAAVPVNKSRRGSVYYQRSGGRLGGRSGNHEARCVHPGRPHRHRAAGHCLRGGGRHPDHRRPRQRAALVLGAGRHLPSGRGPSVPQLPAVLVDCRVPADRHRHPAHPGCRLEPTEPEGGLTRISHRGARSWRRIFVFSACSRPKNVAVTTCEGACAR